MAITELLAKVDAAFQEVEEKRYALEQASATHSATVEDANTKLLKEMEAANAERDQCVLDAQKTYDATVGKTEAEREKARAEMEQAEAAWEPLRAQLASILGTDKTSRATVR